MNRIQRASARNRKTKNEIHRCLVVHRRLNKREASLDLIGPNERRNIKKLYSYLQQ